MLAGMTAANLQGVLESTIDVDVWIDLPSRQYMRVINICRKLEATVQSPNKIYLADDTPVDFIYKVDGLKSFDHESRGAKWMAFHGLKIRVLPLERIRKSKQSVGRDKDKLHILLINQALKAAKGTKRGRQTVKARKR